MTKPYKHTAFDHGVNHGVIGSGICLLVSGIAWEILEHRRHKKYLSEKAWKDSVDTVVSTNGQAELAEETDKHKVMGFGSRIGQ